MSINLIQFFVHTVEDYTVKRVQILEAHLSLHPDFSTFMSLSKLLLNS